MYSYITAQSTYYHQGYDLFEDNDPFMKDVANKVSISWIAANLSTPYYSDISDLSLYSDILGLVVISPSKLNFVVWYIGLASIIY